MTKDCVIATYVDDNEDCVTETWWLYRSWKHSGSDQRSDIALFHNPRVDLIRLPKGEGVIYIPLTPVCETDPMWHDYRRINNTWFLTTPEAEQVVKRYHYTLRTDIDCFLTRNFVNFKPRLATFGLNLYASEDPDVGRRISDICRKWGIKQYHMNSDCNCMANSWVITEYAKLQYQIAQKLKTEEFKDGHGKWPGWYEYVINMYSAGIAANSFFRSGYMLGGLGVMSMSNEPIGSTDYHIHAFHTKEHFSKIKWREGVYDCIDLDELDDSVISAYCIKMAGKRFSKQTVHDREQKVNDPYDVEAELKRIMNDTRWP